jgi:hypothetical protein
MLEPFALEGAGVRLEPLTGAGGAAAAARGGALRHGAPGGGPAY